MGLKILHTADVHIGAKLTYLGQKAAAQRKQIVDTFATLVALTQKDPVDIVLIAGDLFDSPYPSKVSIDSVTNVLKQLLSRGIHIGIIPGNHDRLESGSVFDNSELININDEKLKIFKQPQIEIWEIASLKTVVYGRAVFDMKTKVSPLEGLKLKDGYDYHIGLFHGSVDIHSEPENLPIYKKDIVGSGLSYMALGDWHGMLDLKTDPVPAWYSGAPEFIYANQKNYGHVLYVQIEGKNVEVAPKKLSKLVYRQIQSDISRFGTYSELVKSLSSELNQDQVVVVELTGLRSLDFALDAKKLEEELSASVFFIKVNDKTKLKLSKEELDKFPEDLVLGKFIRLMQTKKNNENSELIDEAIQLGVSILRGEDT